MAGLPSRDEVLRLLADVKEFVKRVSGTPLSDRDDRKAKELDARASAWKLHPGHRSGSQQKQTTFGAFNIPCEPPKSGGSRMILYAGDSWLEDLDNYRFQVEQTWPTSAPRSHAASIDPNVTVVMNVADRRQYPLPEAIKLSAVRLAKLASWLAGFEPEQLVRIARIVAIEYPMLAGSSIAEFQPADVRHDNPVSPVPSEKPLNESSAAKIVLSFLRQSVEDSFAIAEQIPRELRHDSIEVLSECRRSVGKMSRKCYGEPNPDFVQIVCSGVGELSERCAQRVADSAAALRSKA